MTEPSSCSCRANKPMRIKFPYTGQVNGKPLANLTVFPRMQDVRVIGSPHDGSVVDRTRKY